KRYDENAIKLSIINLILTQKYERPLQPELSSKVVNMLFEPLNTGIAGIISKTVKEVITNFEPRGRIVSVFTDPDENKNGYKVYIEFRIINQVEPIRINTFLRRVR
ncbi:MAG: GPW/gp25 family protein, partial [Candidatus Peribacteraceae bacterium]|nr:GPW/gp25 family protein [Candidatus Peribacteraceae bacterium]